MASTRTAAQRKRAKAMARRATYTRAAAPAAAEAKWDEEHEGWEGARGRNGRFPRWPAILGLAIVVLGLADSAYLTYVHFTSVSNFACPETGVINCAAVTTSQWSHILGIPVAILGLVFFLGMLPLMLPVAWRSQHPLIRTARLAGSIVGVGMVIWLVYAELFLIRKICIFCTGVHILTFLLFVVVALGTIATSDPEAAY